MNKLFVGFIKANIINNSQGLRYLAYHCPNRQSVQIANKLTHVKNANPFRDLLNGAPIKTYDVSELFG